jgi:acetoacetyl-CoA synthetase
VFWAALFHSADSTKTVAEALFIREAVKAVAYFQASDSVQAEPIDIASASPHMRKSSMQPLYSPSQEEIEASNLWRFAAHLAASYEGLRSTFFPEERKLSYESMWRWSTEKPEIFWLELAAFAGLKMSRPKAALDEKRGMLGAKWFPGSKLNFAENLLHRAPESQAIVFHSESGLRRVYSKENLIRLTSLFEQHLRASGVGRGDRVCAYAPAVPELIPAMLATAAIGAIWSATSSDFGSAAVVERFGQIDPKVLFGIDYYCYKGKRIDCLDNLRSVRAALPSLSSTCVLSYENGIEGAYELGDPSGANPVSRFAARALEFEALPFDHPQFILYSSGTTGAPKCIVHGAGGTLIQHAKEHLLHGDLHPGEKIFYYTTPGWMMWNWLVSALAVGAEVHFFDGSPFSPSLDHLYKLAETERWNYFGTSASYLLASERAGVRPRTNVDLSSLKAIFSTGSPLLPESFDYVYRDVKSDVRLCSISGGTDIISCFVLGCPLKPVNRGHIQARGLGMDVDVLDESGSTVLNAPGELVCKRAFPSMPVSFWNDPDGSKYRRSYFERFPGLWAHGDFATLSDSGEVVIHGRSDATLNPGGVRIGTAEIYRCLAGLPDIADSVAVGQEWLGSERVILFLKLKEGRALSEDLKSRINSKLRSELSPKHVPAKILAVQDIPRTLNGKLSELAVRRTIEGKEPGNLESLANPESLAHFKNLEELKS